jgi:hypothetical protein
MESMTLKRDDWKLLLEKPPGPCVSLFMPTHRSGPEVQQDQVRLKNLLRQAEGRLVAAGLKPGEAAEVLKPAENMVSDALAWTQRSDGLALFCAPGFFRSFHLPLAFKERVVVSGQRFYLRPLSPLLQGNGHFHVLALSLRQVRLLAATRDSVRRVALEGVPTSFEEAVGTLQTDGPSRLGRQSAVFHGHGSSDQEKLKEEILHYFQQVARGLPERLGDRQAPLVLAAVEEHFPLFREANRHLTVLDDVVAGNPEHLSDRDLQERAWKVAEPWFLRERDEALTRYVDLDGGARTSNDVRELVAAAHQGRVDALFLASEAEQWGSFDPATGEVSLHPEGDEDLIDAAAFYTLLQGGKVYALDPEEVPGGGAAAAVFRY